MCKVITKKESRLFVKKAKEIINLVDHEKVETYQGNNRYYINTNYGKLEINIPEEQQYIYTIFQRFEDVNKAKEVFNCNPYTGKNNIHNTRLEDALWELYDGLCECLGVEDIGEFNI